MLPTRALASKNTIFASFHEQTYIDRKTSRKILDSLVSSFNRSLEKEYGPLPGSAKSNFEAESTRQQNPCPRPQHVDSHLGAILSSPVFTHNKTRPPLRNHSLLGVPSPSHGGAIWGARITGENGALTAQQGQSTPKRDPMDVFDEAVSKGLMTIPRATGCMVAKRKMLEAAAGSTLLRDAMRDAEVGTKVVRWLRSSGTERTLSFLALPALPGPLKTNPNALFLNNLIPFLLAEGLNGIVWSWFSRVLRETKRNPEDTDLRASNASTLVVALIRAQWNALSEEHHIPYDMVLEIDERFTDASTDGFSSKPARAGKLHLSPVYNAWKYVSFHGTMNEIPVPAPPAQLFDRFLTLAEPWGKSVEADMAHLDLHHPTHPKPDRAVEYITQSKPWKSRSLNQPPWTRNTIPRLSRVVQMGVDAINYFVRRGDKAEAAYVYSVLTQLFPWVPWGTFLDGQAEVDTPLGRTT